MTRGRLVTKVLKACLQEGNTEIRGRIEELLNDKLFGLCRRHPYLALRRSKDVTPTASGVLLPSNLQDIRKVRNASTDEDPFEVQRRDKKDLSPEGRGYRFYTEAYGSEPMKYAADVAISKGATSFTSATLSADYSGYYVQFGQEPGYYLISDDSLTFTPTYYGPKLEAGGECIVCPAETQKLFIVDSDEEITTDLSSVRVYYWEAPQPLYLDVQRSPLPLDEALELLILRALPEARQRRPVSQSNIDDVVSRCESLDPAWMFDEVPRARNGVRFDASSTNMFCDRSKVGFPTNQRLPWE